MREKNKEEMGLGGGADSLERSGVMPGEWDWKDERDKKHRPPRRPRLPRQIPLPDEIEILAPYFQTQNDGFRYGILFSEYMRVRYPGKAAGEDACVPYDLLTPIRDAMGSGAETGKLYKLLDDWYEEVKAECAENPDKIREYSLGFGFLLERDVETKKGGTRQ